MRLITNIKGHHPGLVAVRAALVGRTDGEKHHHTTPHHTHTTTVRDPAKTSSEELCAGAAETTQQLTSSHVSSFSLAPLLYSILLLLHMVHTQVDINPSYHQGLVVCKKEWFGIS